MKNIFKLIIVLGILAPTIALANEHKCDCHAHEQTEECKTECAHEAHK